MCADCPVESGDNRPASRRLLPRLRASEAENARAAFGRALAISVRMEAVEHRMTAHVLPWTRPASGPRLLPGKDSLAEAIWIAFVVVQALDGAMTFIGMHTFGTQIEANPLARLVRVGARTGAGAVRRETVRGRRAAPPSI